MSEDIKLPPDELIEFIKGTIYEDDDPAQWGITGDMHEFLEFEALTGD